MSPPRPHLTSKHPGVSRLLRVRCIFSEWTKTRKCSTVCVLGPHIRWCMLPVCWSSVWEVSGVQINWDCWSSYRITLHLTFFQFSLIQQQGSAAYGHWLGVNICIWLFQLLIGSFARQSWQIPFCKCSITSVIVSGLGVSPWAGSHFGPVTGPSFPQAPLHFHPCNSFRHEFFQRCDCGMAIPSLTWCPVFLLEVGSISSFSLLWAFHLRFLRLSPESLLPPRSLVHSGESPQPPISWGCLFPFFSFGPQGFSPFSLPNTRSGSPLPHIPCPIHFPSLVPPTLSTCAVPTGNFLIGPSISHMIFGRNAWAPGHSKTPLCMCLARAACSVCLMLSYLTVAGAPCQWETRKENKTTSEQNTDIYLKVYFKPIWKSA
jgi:hypothetical protein